MSITLEQEKNKMKRKKEKSIQMFDKDIKKEGKYQYTNFQKYSAYIATKRQSEELIKLLKENTIDNPKILDVGCGDGTFTFEILNNVHPKEILGFDRVRSAIEVATNSISKENKRKITFKFGNVYNANKMFKPNSFDIIVVRGVLHHLYGPQKAIKSLSIVSDKIIVLEPNGFNPILKVIERLSQYHRQHEEKSYWPPTLNKWFEDFGFIPKKQTFFGIVPYFCPKVIAETLRFIEPFMESLPLIKRFYCGTNLIYYEKC